MELTRQLGAVPLLIALVMMFAHQGPPAPGLWAAFGLSLGLHLLLMGCYGVCFGRKIGSPSAILFTHTAEIWFPLFLFGIQSAFMFVTAGLIWFTLVELGFPTNGWLQANLVVLLAAIPACRLAADIARTTKQERWAAAFEACRYTTLVLAALWLAGTLTLFMAPPDTPMPPEMYVFGVLLWLIVALLALVCVLLFADHLIRARKGT